MSSFTKFDTSACMAYSLEGSKLLNKSYWLVRGGFRFYIGTLEDDCWVNVPDGFLTDGASVPQILWSLIPPWGAYGQAAVLHDYLCEYLSITRNGVPERITRETADEIFNAAMLVLEVPTATRKTLYAGVTAYRRIAGTQLPSSTAEKRRVEALIAR